MSAGQPGSRWVASVIAVLIAGCAGQTSAPTSAPTAAAQAPTAHPASLQPTRTPIPTRVPPAQPTTAVPAGWNVARIGQLGFGLAAGDFLLGPNVYASTVPRYDKATFEDLGSLAIGKKGAFPPDVQSVAAGDGGVWVTLASQHAVALVNPGSGKTVRRVEVPGAPYDVVQAGHDLWIADFEGATITRFDLERDEVVATIAVTEPTDVVFGEGSVWAAVHVGRHDEWETIEGNGGNIARIDPATNKVSALIPVGPRPYYLAVGFGSVWTGSATGASVWRIDVTTNEAATIPIGEDGAFDIEVVGDSVWVVVGP